jgi:serine/threonine-protein kinase RsbW
MNAIEHAETRSETLPHTPERVKIIMPTQVTCSAADVYAMARDMPEAAYLALGALKSTVPAVRTRARVLWSAWGLAPSLADDASLLLTEMISNALLHTGSETVHVFLRSDRSRLVIMVGDSSPQMPVRADAPADEELFGRGLVIVDAIADRWGAYTVPTGKIVWALLSP